MAAINTELARVYLPGGITKIYGVLTTAGVTTGIICPGYLAQAGDVLLTEGSLNACRGIRKILGWSFTNNTNSNAFKAVKTNDATADADILTVTCTASDSFNYVIEGIDQGQNV